MLLPSVPNGNSPNKEVEICVLVPCDNFMNVDRTVSIDCPPSDELLFWRRIRVKAKYAQPQGSVTGDNGAGLWQCYE